MTTPARTDHRTATTFTMATNGYAPFVLNLHASMERLGLGRDLAVYTLDDDVHAELTAAGLNTRRYGADNRPPWSAWATVEFGRTMALKYVIALEIIEGGRDAFYIDSDIVLLRDPRAHLDQIIRQHQPDIVMQVQVPTHTFNAGLWLARATPATTAAFRALADTIHTSASYVDDQETLNRFIVEENRLKAVPLDPELFACANQFLPGQRIEDGGIYVDRSERAFPFGDAYLLHFNFLTTKQDKARAMLTYGAAFHPAIGRSVPLRKRLMHGLRVLLGQHRRTP